MNDASANGNGKHHGKHQQNDKHQDNGQPANGKPANGKSTNREAPWEGCGHKVGQKYWKGPHNCWYCRIVHPNGKPQDKRLERDPQAAEERRWEIIKEIRDLGRPDLDYTVDGLIQLFLTHVEKNNPKATYRWYKNFLKSFGESIGPRLRVRELKLHHVQNWLTKKYPQKGNPNTRHNAIACLKRLFNWAIRDMGYFDRNPLNGLKKPQRTRRDGCPSKEQWAEVLAHYGPEDAIYDFLDFMLATGCRPQEVRVIEARHIDYDARLVRFADGEIPGKKFGRDVEVPERMVAVLKKHALAHPTGPIFRNEDGNPWKHDSLNCRLQRVKKKFPGFRFTWYSGRHTKATDLLENGASTGAVASLLGHRDPTVVLKFYGRHIEQRREHLRGLIEADDQRALVEKTDQPPEPPEPEKGQEQGEAIAQQEDGNSLGLKVVGEGTQLEAKPTRKGRKRDAG